MPFNSSSTRSQRLETHLIYINPTQSSGNVYCIWPVLYISWPLKVVQSFLIFELRCYFFGFWTAKKPITPFGFFFFLAFSLYHDPVKIRISFAPNLAFWLKRNITNTWPVFFFWPNRADDVMASSSKVQNPFESVLKNMSKRCGAIYMNDVGGM